jgi:hypothetical protein
MNSLAERNKQDFQQNHALDIFSDDNVLAATTILLDGWSIL